MVKKECETCGLSRGPICLGQQDKLCGNQYESWISIEEAKQIEEEKLIEVKSW